MMETLLTWVKGLPTILSSVFDILLIAVIFLTAFTLIFGVWIGFCITRKRMNSIVELQFLPPKITFRDKTDK
jgi:ribose/xylose/arabinose/galactoside ABC-type transport system permease subunit